MICIIERVRKFLNTLKYSDVNIKNRYLLGAGSVREAYEFEEQYVIKIPRFIMHKSNYTKNELHIIYKGEQQSLNEIRIYNSCDNRIKKILNPIIMCDYFENTPFIVMPKIKIASEVVGLNASGIMEFIKVLDLSVPWTFNLDLSRLISTFGLYSDDLYFNLDNFGIDGSNRFLITDYGFAEFKS